MRSQLTASLASVGAILCACDVVEPKCDAQAIASVALAVDTATVRVAETRRVTWSVTNGCGAAVLETPPSLVLPVGAGAKVSARVVGSSLEIVGVDTGEVRIGLAMGGKSSEVGVRVIPPLPAFRVLLSMSTASVAPGTVVQVHASVRDSLFNELPRQWAPVAWSADSSDAEHLGDGRFRFPYQGSWLVRARSGDREGTISIPVAHREVTEVWYVGPTRISVGDSARVVAAGGRWDLFPNQPGVAWIREAIDSIVSTDTSVVAVSLSREGVGHVIGRSRGRASVRVMMSGRWNPDWNGLVEVDNPTEFLPDVVTMSSECAVIMASRRAVCWGENSVGTLGRAVYVPGTDMFERIVSGRSHRCGIRTDSTAVCWGMNLDGALGTGSTESSTVPVPVVGERKFTAIAMPYSYASGHTCAVAADSLAWCWGANTLGQLGDGSTTSSTARSLVPVPVAGGHKFVAIGAGLGFTCGIRADGAVLCWGYLGGPTAAVVPTAMPLLPRARALTVERDLRCVVTENAAVSCWRDFRSAPTTVGGLAGVSSVAVMDSTVCAVVSTGVRCSRELRASGQHAGWSLTFPVPESQNFRTIIGGPSHMCAHDNVRLAWCWGSNVRGELGDGTDVSRTTPVRVLAPADPP